MGVNEPVSVAIEFVERLNRRDFEALARLMSSDHHLFPGGDHVIAGRENARASLSEYAASWPDFQIHIAEIYLAGETVVMVGRTTGSCAGLSRESEICETRIYAARVADGRVTEFRHLDDTPETRGVLGLAAARKITG